MVLEDIRQQLVLYCCVSRVYCAFAYLPELLGRVLASDSLENLGATGVLIDEVCHVVDIAFDGDPDTAGLRGLVRLEVLLRDRLGHD